VRLGKSSLRKPSRTLRVSEAEACQRLISQRSRSLRRRERSICLFRLLQVRRTLWLRSCKRRQVHFSQHLPPLLLSGAIS